ALLSFPYRAVYRRHLHSFPTRRSSDLPRSLTMPQKKGPESVTPGEVQFLTVAEVAAMMRVSKMTVYRLVHSGELPAVRVGKSFRVPEKAVHSYLESAYYDVG